MLKKNLKKIRFGIEIEFTGLDKEKVLDILENYFGSEKTKVNGRSAVLDKKGRVWLVVRDSSVTPMIKISDIDTLQDGYISVERIANIASKTEWFKGAQVEVVSPVCKLEDIDVIQDLVSLFKQAGARVNNSCGIHIHIDKSMFTVKDVMNLVFLMKNIERTLYSIFSISYNRKIKYCKPLCRKFLDNCSDLYNNDLLSNDEKYKYLMMKYYYNADNNVNTYNKCLQEMKKKYSKSRYYGLNLHNYFRGNTVEFRYFNSSLDINIVKTYIYFVIAVSIKAIEHSNTSKMRYKWINRINYEKWFKNFGLDKEEYATIRNDIIGGLKDEYYFYPI